MKNYPKLLVLIVFILFTIILCVSHSKLKGQEENLDDLTKEELLDSLESPLAEDRINAGIKLQELVDEKDLKSLLKEKPTALIELLSQGWPTKAGNILEDIYKIEDKGLTKGLLPAFAGILLENHQTSRIDEDEAKLNTFLREYWYLDWKLRRPIDFIWGKQLHYISNRTWLRNLLYQDKAAVIYYASWAGTWRADREAGEVTKTIVSILANENKPNLEANVVKYEWLKVLRDCHKDGKNHILDHVIKDDGGCLGYKTSSAIGAVAYAEIICLILDKPEWIPEVEKLLEKTNTIKQIMYFEKMDSTWRVKNQDAIIDNRNSVVKLMWEVNNGSINKAIDSLDSYFHNKWPDFGESRWDPKVLVHHEWFENARLSPTFMKTFKDWEHAMVVVDPDPESLNTTWNNQ